MSAPFAAKERVLCYHGPLIYEAKVLEVKHFEGTDGPSGQPGWGFYVHYKGWKQKCVHGLFAHASGGSALRRVLGSVRRVRRAACAACSASVVARCSPRAPSTAFPLSVALPRSTPVLMPRARQVGRMGRREPRAEVR
jgi:hypothetical protein